MSGWCDKAELLQHELIQRIDEGCDPSDELRRRSGSFDRESAAAEALYGELCALKPDPELAAREPNDLAAIRALRPDGPRDFNWQPDEPELLDRLHGAWTGRCLGCAIGKPVEGMGLSADADGKPDGRGRIRAFLEAAGDWPLDDFFTARKVPGFTPLPCRASTREHVAWMEADDDIHYSLTAIGVLEECGFGFTWRDVARYWINNIPVGAICTAELQAIQNVLNHWIRLPEAAIPVGAAFTRRHWNPFREWIGAQIRADGWAWACAGRPELAAELAWRDASWTHERNGIYGELFMAAMQAAAFVVHEPFELIHIGLSEIPVDCRLARAVRMALAWFDECRDFDDAMDRLEEDPWLGRLHPVHTINNAALCVLALMYGNLDTQRTVCLAVSGGLDTDCNGASTGSILGALTGRKAMPDRLAGRLNDRIRPRMPGFHDVTMREMARRTAALWHAQSKGIRA